jgi:surface polysaccharide O-acyltransferase-like enzyme
LGAGISNFLNGAKLLENIIGSRIIWVVSFDPMSTQASTKPRMFYIDNIRIYLTILVILHHVAVAYGGMGGWPLKEPATDSISPIIFLLFNALNQSYFMSFFFILAGYFTPRSLERKGSISFMKGRLIRLGIPLIFFLLILAPLTYWVVANIANNLNVPISQIWREVLTFTSLQNISFGHLWFLEALLIFALIYVLYKNTSNGNKPKQPVILYENSFPPNRIIALCIFVLSIVTFIVRIWFPIGVSIFSLQFAHMPHYFFSFFVGILAYRGDWFSHLSRSQARLWGKVALVNTIVLPIVFVLGSRGGVDAFLGGITWQSFANATWETVSFLSIIIWLLDFFKNRFNNYSRVLGWMSPNVFAAYIFHQVLVVMVMIPFLGFTWPSVLKFVVVSLISIPLCFLFSSVIRSIPYVNRVI